jgi:hypothetical protein
MHTLSVMAPQGKWKYIKLDWNSIPNPEPEELSIEDEAVDMIPPAEPPDKFPPLLESPPNIPLRSASPSQGELTLAVESPLLSAHDIPPRIRSTPGISASNRTEFMDGTNQMNSEFPSLGAPAQQQNAPSAQSMWSNPSIRAPIQHTQSSVQRNPPSSSQQQAPQEEASPFVPGSDSYRFGSAGSQLAGLAQTPTQAHTGSTEDFPPLGGLGANDAEPRGSLLSAFGAPSGLSVQTSRLSIEQGGEIAFRGMTDRNVSLRL